jgi:hypothetical protein
MGAVGTKWEPDAATWEVGGTIKELLAPYGNHMCHMEAIWELCAPGGRRMVPDGSCMCRMGAIYLPSYPMGDRWHHMGATWDVWGAYESRVQSMGAMCNILEVDGSHMVPSASFTEPSGSHHQYGTICLPYAAIWLPYLSHKMHMAPIQCTWHPYSAHGTLLVHVAPFASYGSQMGAI